MKIFGTVLCFLFLACGTRREWTPSAVPAGALSVEWFNDSVKAVYSLDSASGFLIRRWYCNEKPFRIDVAPIRAAQLPDSLREKLRKLLPDYQKYNYRQEFENGFSINVY